MNISNANSPTGTLLTPADKRYFNADAGGASFYVVARDLKHAKQLLRDAGVEFTSDDGNSYPINAPEVASATWREISALDAAKKRVWLGDNGAPPPIGAHRMRDWRLVLVGILMRFKLYSRRAIVAYAFDDEGTVGLRRRGGLGLLHTMDGIPHAVVKRSDVADVAVILACIDEDLGRDACRGRGVEVDV